MSGLLILGAGGHGKVVAEAATDTENWDEITFLDDCYPELEHVLKWKVIGRIADAPQYLEKYPDLVIAIGNNARRVEWLRKLTDTGFRLPCIVHPRAFVSSSAELGPGTVVFAQAAVNAQTRIGIGGIVNTGATVDHDCLLAEGVHVSPGAHLAGEVKVGQYGWIGIGACVLQQIILGDNVIVGAGSAVIQDIPDDVTVAGVPARIIKHH